MAEEIKETKNKLGKTSIGMEPNIAALLSYVLFFVSGIVFYIIEKKNKFVRFHAMQSIIVFAFFFVAHFVFGVLYIIPFLGRILYNLFLIFELVVWIVLMVKAFQGDMFKLPVVGDIADKNS
jgi:uncharacterized membrane protein